MVPPSRLSDHSDDVPCKLMSECSLPRPAPVPPTPLPTPPPSSSADSHGRVASFVTALTIAGSALAFVVLFLSVFLIVRLRRRRRRRREALLEAALAPAAPAATPNDGGGGGLDLEEAEQGEVVHHAWHIQAVGLDEAAIESITLTRYRAGAGGVLGASDCAVCLGEFTDGEPLRLLPRCAHAFHVHCIDTWLRAHVQCPLCRSHVLDPPARAAAAEPSDSPAGADAGQAASSIGTTELEQPDQQASEQRELRLQIDQHEGQSNSPEQQPHRHTGPLGGNIRRVVSMDLPSPTASAEEAAPKDDEQAGGEKQGTGGAVHCELSPGPGCSDRLKNHRGMKRSLSVGSRWALVSRHCRRSSSLLPL